MQTPKRQLDPGHINFLSPVSLTLGNKETKDALEKAALDPNLGVKGFIADTLKVNAPKFQSAPLSLPMKNHSLKPEMRPLKLNVSEELVAKKAKLNPITLPRK